VLERVRTLTDPNEFEKFTGKILLDSVTSLANKWLGVALDNSSVESFLGIAQDVVREYEQARQTFGHTVFSALDLYEDYLRRGDVARLREALAAVSKLDSREALCHLLPDPRTSRRRKLGNASAHWLAC
jgi:hypothetical protein